MNREQLVEMGFEVRRFELEERGPDSGTDRTGWGPGAWDGEPDRVEWRAGGSALPRLVVRGPHGSWCGYVGLPPGHPLHGVRYDDPRIEACDVHGGPTFANECGGHICHVPKEGEPEHVWWIGFDLAHSGDTSPGMDALLSKHGGLPRRSYGTYKPLAYVVGETEKLAAQLEGAGGQ